MWFLSISYAYLDYYEINMEMLQCNPGLSVSVAVSGKIEINYVKSTAGYMANKDTGARYKAIAQIPVTGVLKSECILKPHRLMLHPEVCVNEHVDVAVHHPVQVAHLFVCSMVLHHPVRIEDV